MSIGPPSAISRQPEAEKQVRNEDRDRTATPLPLAGLTILDLSRLLPGPYCTHLMALLGAEVIKIEEPGLGDMVRLTPPHAANRSVFFGALNRNKKSVTINMKHPEGRGLLLDLAKRADGIVESFRPGVMDKLGLSWKVLSDANPRLIYLAISGYGQSGPYKLKAGHDLNYNSLAGIIGITGGEDGRPVIPGAQIADVPGGALFGLIAFLAVLHSRAVTGKGTYIDQAMTEGSLSLLTHFMSAYAYEGQNPRPRNMELNGKHPCYNIYGTKDGRYMSLGALEPKFWQTFCRAVGRPEWEGDHFPPAERRSEVLENVERLFRTRTQEEWTKFFAEVDCCCEPVLSFSEVRSHPQHRARNMFTTESVRGEKVDILRAPFLMDGDAPSPPFHPAPDLGEHTDEVLSSLGLSHSRIKSLHDEGVI